MCDRRRRRLLRFLKFGAAARDDFTIIGFHDESAILSNEAHEALQVFSAQAVAVADGKIADRFAVSNAPIRRSFSSFIPNCRQSAVTFSHLDMLSAEYERGLCSDLDVVASITQRG
jgi:hypothetical protein